MTERDFPILLAAAMSLQADADDRMNLLVWLDRYTPYDFNGTCYDLGNGHSLRPVFLNHPDCGLIADESILEVIT